MTSRRQIGLGQSASPGAQHLDVRAGGFSEVAQAQGMCANIRQKGEPDILQ